MYMDLSKISGGWAVQNLRQYGNSLIPPELIKEFGRDKIEGVLSAIIGEPVWIEKHRYPQEQTPVGYHGKRGFFYIARTARDPAVTKKTAEMKRKKWEEKHNDQHRSAG